MFLLAGIPGQSPPSSMQTEGGCQRSEGQPGPQREPCLHLPVASAVCRAAAGLPTLRANHGLVAHPAERPGGEAEAGRGAAGGPFQQPESVRRRRRWMDERSQCEMNSPKKLDDAFRRTFSVNLLVSVLFFFRLIWRSAR